MFYEKQSKEQKDNYKSMLNIIGSLSNVFSESEKPYLYYRCHENIFCKYFEAKNLSREDCSADAQKGNIGIGLKTWIGSDNQKVAEFNKLKSTYENLEPIEMIKKIAEYRNERIRVTKKLHGINEMIYHIVKRVPNAMEIYECAFEPIDIGNIKILEDKSSKKNIYFTDGKHVYHFVVSKSTLYMIFDYLEKLDSFEVGILKDPYTYLEAILTEDESLFADILSPKEKYEKLCLRLYTINRQTNEKTIKLQSGLNQWNGYRRDSRTGTMRPRNPNELYIPYPVFDRNRSKGFFPPINESFELTLPDGKVISAKVCQQNGKAIMSNPNSELGKWLLRDVFNLPEGTIVTYSMLEKFGIDSVIFTKLSDKKYKIDFTDLGTYEKLLNDQNIEIDDIIEDEETDEDDID